MSEHLEQVKVVSWFRKSYPYKIYAIPNGGQRTKSFGAKQKAEGMVKGVSDLHVPALNLWIEMKLDASKKPSKEQLEWGEYVESIGHKFMVGYGHEDAIKKIKEFIEKDIDLN